MANSDLYSDVYLLGDAPPLLASRARGMPERRQISLRWLSGAILTGVTSVMLMGGALITALDGRQEVTSPPRVLLGQAPGNGGTAGTDLVAEKGDKPRQSLRYEASQSRRLMVPTVTIEGDREVVKARPFKIATVPLAVVADKDLEYPRFDALAIFSDSGRAPEPTIYGDSLYGADVDSEVTIKFRAFAAADPQLDTNLTLTAAKSKVLVERHVAMLAQGQSSDTATFLAEPNYPGVQPPVLGADGVRITAENVTTLQRIYPAPGAGMKFEDRIITIKTERSLFDVLAGEGVPAHDAEKLAEIIAIDLDAKTLKRGDKVRAVHELAPDGSILSVGRISVYRGVTHLVSVAGKDDGGFAYANAPDMIPAISAAGAVRPVVSLSGLPNVYDGIYRAGLTEGMDKDMVHQLVRIFAFDVDFKSRAGPGDQLSVLYSVTDSGADSEIQPEILYAAVRANGVEYKFYRYLDRKDGGVGYYDRLGKSARKFLLRKPVPAGRFQSPFGMRRHPISRVRKMHQGVDWAAPRGTPIVAAGNGVVDKAGWSRGHGKRTIIRHANGYVTSYSHQTSIAKGVVPGARVRQGQIIGAVGSTGYTTGPHLHYEVTVNGNKVDPMRIRLPKGRVLKGETLATFEIERDRIEEILIDDDRERVRLASN